MSHRNPLGKSLLGDDKTPGPGREQSARILGRLQLYISGLAKLVRQTTPLSFVSPKITLSYFRSVSIRLPTPQFCSGALSQARVFGADLVQLFFF